MAFKNLLSKIESGLSNADQFLDTAESTIVNIIAKVAPWAAPFPTAFLVADRTMTNLNWPIWVALPAAVAIETLGLSTTALFLRLYRYNKTRKQHPPSYTPEQIAKSRMKVEPAAPMILPGLLVGIYIVTAELLTVVLDIAAKGSDLKVVDFAPAIFPLLSLTGVTTLAIQADHTQRIKDNAEAKKPKQKTESAKPKEDTSWAEKYQCWCGAKPTKKATAQNWVGGHSRRHQREASQFETAKEANQYFVNAYPEAWAEHTESGGSWPSLREIMSWIATKRKEDES